MPLDDDLTAELLDPFGVPLPTDPDEIFDEMVAKMQERVPRWEPVPTAVEVHVMRAVAEVHAETRLAAKNRLRSLSLEYHSTMFGIARSIGVAARSSITVTARDAMGYTLPARTTAHVGDVECETAAELVVPPGATRGSVAIVCVELGAAPNGAAGDVEVDALDWLAATDGVVLDGPLALGEDEEEDGPYALRAVEELQLLTRTPILPPNYVVVARRHPLVGHAWALDGYDPVSRTFDNERMVTIAAVDAVGGELDSDVLDEIRTMVAALRETTFEPHAISPTPVPVDVVAEVRTFRGWDPPAVADATRARISEVLLPVNWLMSPYGVDPSFVPTPLVHANELVAQADRVGGVDIVTSLQLTGGRTSVALGPLELPTPGTITVTARGP